MTCKDGRSTFADAARVFVAHHGEIPSPEMLVRQCNHYLHHLRRGSRRHAHHDLRVQIRAIRERAAAKQRPT